MFLIIRHTILANNFIFLYFVHIICKKGLQNNKNWIPEMKVNFHSRNVFLTNVLYVLYYINIFNNIKRLLWHIIYYLYIYI